MTVLCLVELGAGGAVADASLRALTFSRELAASAAPEAPGTRPMSHRAALNPSDVTSDGLVAAAVFAPEAEVPAARRAGDGALSRPCPPAAMRCLAREKICRQFASVLPVILATSG